MSDQFIKNLPLLTAFSSSPGYLDVIEIEDYQSGASTTNPALNTYISSVMFIKDFLAGIMAYILATVLNLGVWAEAKVTVNVISTDTTKNIDLSAGLNFYVNLANTASCALAFINNQASGSQSMTFLLCLKQDATGGRAISWPASVKWPNGTQPTLDTTLSTATVLSFTSFDGGTTYTGGVVYGKVTGI